MLKNFYYSPMKLEVNLLCTFKRFPNLRKSPTRFDLRLESAESGSFDGSEDDDHLVLHGSERVCWFDGTAESVASALPVVTAFHLQYWGNVIDFSVKLYPTSDICPRNCEVHKTLCLTNLNVALIARLLAAELEVVDEVQFDLNKNSTG